MLAGSMLTIRQAALSLGAFLVLGIVGIPLFAGGVGGLGIIAGPRGGYLVGFLVGAVVIALLKGNKNNVLRLGSANIIGGIVVIYLFGVLWLSYVMGIGLIKAFYVGAVPYLPGDLLKAIIAVAVSIKVNPYLKQQAAR
jgi:biotin transport system substrate-specific component